LQADKLKIVVSTKNVKVNLFMIIIFICVYLIDLKNDL